MILRSKDFIPNTSQYHVAMALQAIFGHAEIPDHDPITRRKQFRAKKDRAEQLRQKKTEKKAKKESKKAEKESKKGDKKAEKESKKAGKGEGEEQDQGKDEKKKKKRLQEELPGKGGHVVEPVPKRQERLGQVYGVEPGHHKKTRGKGLKRLRRANAEFKKNNAPVVEDVATAQAEVPKKGTSEKNRSNKAADKMKTTKATKEVKDHKVEDESTSRAENKRKVNNKKEEGLSRKVAKRSSKVEAPVDDEVKKNVKGVLQECRKTHCCHPSFEVPKFDKKVFQVSVYWNRKAVGIKLHKSKVSDHKGSKGTFVQVAYFGCQTNCTYSNIALAHLYVSCSQWLYKFIPSLLRFCIDHQAALKIWDQCSILCINVHPLGQNIQECGDMIHTIPCARFHIGPNSLIKHNGF